MYEIAELANPVGCSQRREILNNKRLHFFSRWHQPETLTESGYSACTAAGAFFLAVVTFFFPLRARRFAQYALIR